MSKGAPATPAAASCVLEIKAVPNSRATALTGRVGNAWKIKVHAAPEDGRANKELLAFLAGKLALPASALEVAAGAASREKRIRVHGLAAGAAEARLAATDS